MDMVVISSIVAVVMGILVMFVRMRASKKPASAKKIILPPFFMSTGALMYIFPQFRISGAEILESVIIGALFSILLIATSKFEVRDSDIYLKRSKAFVFVLFGLLFIRIALKSYLSSTIDVGELGGMFFLLAFSMLLPWRIAMYFSYKKLYSKLHPPKIHVT
ncbi:cytochrome c biogenesis protein CcdC [Metabacillus sp. GX 13764]|uniref:CcdC family protein n=1 Tax=Metabacillus kandeliae TaxID=2900151 RepID=UPI001E617820|nr:cytochrome c biogenesis protein CcdC [Metabacillus kandeliae]MCD7033659.1 cytochrome c biogenesis protein CcdC [Metabacillus kandeliae]